MMSPTLPEAFPNDLREMLGPLHPRVPKGLKLTLDLNGSVIRKVQQIETGFLSRNIEQKVLGLHPVSAHLWISRVDPEQAYLFDVLFADAIRTSLGFPALDRLDWIEEVVLCLSDLSLVLLQLIELSEEMRAHAVKSILFKHRENLLELNDLLTGSRYGYHFIQIRGARYQMTQGFLERASRWSEELGKDFDRIREFFFLSEGQESRWKSMGLLLTRETSGFLKESSVESTKWGWVNHVDSRIRRLFAVLSESHHFLRTLCEQEVDGDFQYREETLGRLNQIEGDAHSSLENWRGTYDLLLSFQNGKLTKFQMSTPSHALLNQVSDALEDEDVEDVGLILKSMSLRLFEVDQ